MKEWEAGNGEKLYMIMMTMLDNTSIATAFKHMPDTVDKEWQTVADHLMTLLLNDVTPAEIATHLKQMVKQITEG